jgi:hypothetical protein
VLLAPPTACSRLYDGEDGEGHSYNGEVFLQDLWGEGEIH